MGLENTAVLSLGYLLKLEAIFLIVLCGEGSNYLKKLFEGTLSG